LTFNNANGDISSYTVSRDGGPFPVSENGSVVTNFCAFAAPQITLASPLFATQFNVEETSLVGLTNLVPMAVGGEFGFFIDAINNSDGRAWDA